MPNPLGAAGELKDQFDGHGYGSPGRADAHPLGQPVTLGLTPAATTMPHAGLICALGGYTGGYTGLLEALPVQPTGDGLIVIDCSGEVPYVNPPVVAAGSMAPT